MNRPHPLIVLAAGAALFATATILDATTDDGTTTVLSLVQRADGSCGIDDDPDNDQVRHRLLQWNPDDLTDSAPPPNPHDDATAGLAHPSDCDELLRAVLTGVDADAEMSYLMHEAAVERGVTTLRCAMPYGATASDWRCNDGANVPYPDVPGGGELGDSVWRCQPHSDSQGNMRGMGCQSVDTDGNRP